MLFGAIMCCGTAQAKILRSDWPGHQVGCALLAGRGHTCALADPRRAAYDKIPVVRARATFAAQAYGPRTAGGLGPAIAVP
jgi:hypothetical protein